MNATIRNIEFSLSRSNEKGPLVKAALELREARYFTVTISVELISLP